MKQFGKIFCLALGFGILAAVLASVPSRPVAQAMGAAPVLVTNTTAQAVPTSAQGTTAIAGTVQAQQNGTWNVGINGNVTVGNTASSPVLVRDVDNPARHPFQKLLCSGLANFACQGAPPSFTVDSGKQLVIEFVAWSCTTQSSSSISSVVLISAPSSGDFNGAFWLSVPPLGPSATSFASQLTRIYAGPTTIPTVQVVGSATASSPAGCFVQLSGSEVSVP